MAKKNKYTELIANTGALAIGNFSSKILVFLLVPLYTSVLTTEEYGFYDLVFTTIQLLIPVFTCNVTDAVLRFTLESENHIKQLVNITLKFLVLSLLPAFLTLLAITASGISRSTREYGGYIFAFYLLRYNVKRMAAAGVVGTLVTVISCLIMLLIIKTGLKGFFLSNILGQAVPAVYLICTLHLWKYVDIGISLDLELQRRLLKYSLPLILTNIGWWLNNTSDKYIITFMSGMSLNGLLSVAYKIPSILSIIYGLFIQAWQISAIKEYTSEDSRSFYNRVFLYLNIFVYCVAAALILFTKPIARLAFAKDFYSAWEFVPFLLISGVFTASAGFIAPILTSAYNTKAVVKATIYGGIVNIFLNIVLLYCIGPQGVSIATAISSFVIFYVRYHGLGGIIERKNLWRILLLWLLLIIQSAAELLGWYGAELFILAIAFIWNFKHVYELIQKLKSFFINRYK